MRSTSHIWTSRPYWRSFASTPTHHLRASYSSGHSLKAFRSSIATATSKEFLEANAPHSCGGSFSKARHRCARRPRTGFSRNFAAGTMSCSSSSPSTMAACMATFGITCAQMSGDRSEQVGGYLSMLVDRYRLIEKQLPIFAKTTGAGRAITWRITSCALACRVGESGRRSELPAG